MADIQTYLDYILSKTYGGEVRQAIVDAINQCYADAAAGVTPVITTSEITGGTRITITVGSIATNVDVMDGTATDEQVEEWLDNHPEATTSVADGSISTAKLADGAVTAAKLDPNINLGVADNSVTTPKIVDHNVTFAKTDFYYDRSLQYTLPSWMTLLNSGRSIHVASSDIETAVANFPDVLTLVGKSTSQYNLTFSVGFTARSSSWQNKSSSASVTRKTISLNGAYYNVGTVTKEAVQTAYEAYLEDLNNGYVPRTDNTGGLNLTLGATNVNVYTGDYYYVEGEVTAEMIEANFTEKVMSEDFATAVKHALESDEGTSTDEETAKEALSGKVMICLGDSYTVGMGGLLSSVAAKYEMAYDARGLVSSPITGDTNTSPRPFWYRANTIVSDYENGYAINGTTYAKSDVGVVVFMGGANDGFGVETFIGTGIHETDKTKIYGACGYIFDLLAQTFPNAKYICITQPSNYNRTVSSITDDATAQTLGFENLAELQQMNDIQFSNYSMAQKEDAVKKSAWAYGWQIIDMFNEMPSIFSSANRTLYWNSDKLHLTNAGYTLISQALDKKIVELTVR